VTTTEHPTEPTAASTSAPPAPTTPEKERVISTDDHAFEKPDTFLSRVPARFREDCLQLRRLDDGTDWWVFAGEKVRAVSTGAAAMRRDRGPVRTFDELPPAAYEAAERLEVMDADGVDVEVLFPQASGFGGGAFMTGAKGTELCLASIRAYNDYLVEEWTSVSERFVPQALVPLWDPRLAAQELRRAVEMGHRALVFSGAPQNLGLPHFNDQVWDPVWSTAQELDVPVALHIGSGGLAMDLWQGYSSMRRLAMVSVNAITSNLTVMGNLLLSGVLERFPRLKVVSVESGMGWVPYLLETADHQYESQHLADEAGSLKPSELFRRNCYVNFWYERSGIELRYHVGVDNIMWEADFPHPTSTYPHSRRFIEECLQGVPSDERRKILSGNAERVYGLAPAA
jgi:predicted TIM-barrel fold metal-dependent hydrolase